MQIPKRRYDKRQGNDSDPHITQAKANELTAELDRLIKIVRPRLSHEVAEHAKLGDFSENAAYQIAKGKLRGINHRILLLEDMLNQAIIIPECSSGECVQIGSTVTVQINGQKKIFIILGSQETDPGRGIISHLSPIGSALLGHRKNDEVEVEIADRTMTYKILEIK